MIKRSRPQGSDNTRSARSHLVLEMSGEQRFAYWAFGLSLIVHLAIFGVILATMKHKPGKIPKTSVINVSLVATPQKAARSSTTARKAVTTPKAKTSKKKETLKETVTVAPKP